MIDMHAHWRPAELADALRTRTKEPRIVRNDDGVEIMKSRMGDQPLSEAFDDVDFHLDRMDRQGVTTSALSLLGQVCWIESQPVEVSLPLCRMVNDRFSEICVQHPGRFAAFAAFGSCAGASTPPRCRWWICPLPQPSLNAHSHYRAWSAPRCRATASSPPKTPRKCARYLRSQTGIARLCLSIMVRGRATRFPKSAATPTMHAAATARSTCKRACRP